MADQRGTFGSPAELADLLESIGLRLHAKNRIGGGESNYLWHLAETIRGAGRLAAQFGESPAELRALFGDRHDAGSIPAMEQQGRIFLMLAEASGKA